MRLTTEGRRAAPIAFLCLALAAGTVSAQAGGAVTPSTGRNASREQLEAAAQEFDRLAASLGVVA